MLIRKENEVKKLSKYAALREEVPAWTKNRNAFMRLSVSAPSPNPVHPEKHHGNTSCCRILPTGNLQGRDHHPGGMRPPGGEDGKSERIRAAGMIYHEWRGGREMGRRG